MAQWKQNAAQRFALLAGGRVWTMLESKKTRSQKTARKWRRIPPVQCTLC